MDDSSAKAPDIGMDLASEDTSLSKLFQFTSISESESDLPQHPRSSLYKAKDAKSSQAQRRLFVLESQKKKRFDIVNRARKLATIEKLRDDGEMDCDSRPARPPRIYKDQLMMSEWMFEVPEDLSENWLLVLCPKSAKRCLIVASKGSTTAYSRNGYRLTSFPSYLPGGNRKELSEQKCKYTLLDGFYSENDKVFYLLDMICWNGHPLYDSETEFRFYWLQTKLKEECPKAFEVSPLNPYKFVVLPSYTCDANTLKQTLWSPLPFHSDLDGLLFFHKKVHYTPNTVPLLCWLKGFMVPEKLNIDVPESLCKDRPSDYVNMEHYVKSTQKAVQKRKDEENSMQLGEN